MSLRGRIRRVALMALVIVVVLCGAFLFVRLKTVQIERKIALAETLIIDSSQLRAVIFDYLLYRETRPRLQVEAKLGDLHTLLEDQAQLIADDTVQDERAKVLWENVRQRLAECESLFAALVGQEADPTLRERDRRTADLLLLSSQSLALSFGQIHRMTISALLETHSYEEMTLWMLLAGLSGLGTILFLLLRKDVLVPLQQLHEAAIRVAAGQQNHRLRSPRRDEFGQLAHAFDHMLDQLATVSRDRLEAEMSERKRIEIALRQSEAVLRESQRLAGVGDWAWDIRTGLHAWSEEIYLIYGRDPALPPADIEEVQKYFTPESWACLSAAVETCLAQGIPYECDAEVVRADGAHRWIIARGEPMRDAGGTVVGLHGTVRDITERKRAETEIHRLNAELEERVHRRTAELEAANQELESFAYAVSHDLRAPLRAMSGFSQALLEDYGAQLEGEGRVYLDQIVLASDHMSQLIDGLLVLSRSTRGELRRERVDLAAMAERLLAKQAAAEPERQVVWQVEPNLSAQGDPMMLEVVMRNLIENAWKYTAKAPNATIRVYSEEREGERCWCVADNGAGFDMSHANRLFKAFQRLHRQDEFPGTGIGLATVQRIIHRHGGVIRAEAAPRRGATFCFTLPGAETLCEETA